MRYQLTDHEWVAIKSMLPNKPRGVGNFLSPSLMRAGTGRPTRWAYPGQGPWTTTLRNLFRFVMALPRVPPYRDERAIPAVR